MHLCGEEERPALPRGAQREVPVLRPGRLARGLPEKGQRKAVRLLRAFRKVYEDKPHIYNSAMMRVPEELREDLHARALAGARPPAHAPRGPRGKSAADSAAAAAVAWDAQLASRKRALRPLGKKKWTAYKKRRTADRSRVVKKFYVDQGLPPPPSEVARDVAENDCGLPALEGGERANFVEAWCKLGSWGVCGKCHSLQPRPAAGHAARGEAGHYREGLQALPAGRTCPAAGRHPAPPAAPESGPSRSTWARSSRRRTASGSTRQCSGSVGRRAARRRRSSS